MQDNDRVILAQLTAVEISLLVENSVHFGHVQETPEFGQFVEVPQSEVASAARAMGWEEARRVHRGGFTVYAKLAPASPAQPAEPSLVALLRDIYKSEIEQICNRQGERSRENERRRPF